MTWGMKVALLAAVCGCGELVEGMPAATDDDDEGTTTEPQGITLTTPSTGPNATSASSSGTDASDSDPTEDPTTTTEPDDTSATTEPVEMTTSGDPSAGSSEGSEESGEPVDPGFLDCLNDGEEAACIGTEACVYDIAAAPSVGVCAGMDCASVEDCPDAPAGGDAMPACMDIANPEGNECILDCSGGETCPTGMICFASLLCVWAQEGLAVEDFEDAQIPASWTLHDVDGNTPNSQVSFIDDAWVIGMTGSGDLVAMSTSFYSPAGTADDWLVTPPVAIGAASTLVFEARSPDSGFPDGYEVRISTTGADVADFMGTEPLLTVEEEQSTFTEHTIDLAAAGYADETVWIAWRNTSTDKFVLQVDDIEITY
jgi:hypothetical protein